MFNIFARKPKLTCGQINHCSCESTSTKRCSACIHHYMVDNEGGYCRALPTAIEVPWCRIGYDMFTFDKNKKQDSEYFEQEGDEC